MTEFEQTKLMYNSNCTDKIQTTLKSYANSSATVCRNVD